jgi:hypothetical protein
MEKREIRNLKYAKETKPMICGDNSENDGVCSTKWASNNFVNCDYHRNTRSCPDGWVHSSWSNQYCDGITFDARVCSRGDVDSKVWNDLNKEILELGEQKTVSGIKKMEKLEKDAIECCRNINDTSAKFERCGNYNKGFKGGSEPLKDIYDDNCAEVYKKFCTRNIDNMNTADCIRWCQKYTADSEAIRKKFCNNVSDIDIESGKYKELCACSYKDSFYNNIRTKLSQKFGIPNELLSGSKQCYFPDCQENKFKENYPCKDLTLVNCLQNINLDISSSKVDDIKINALNNCTANIVKKGTNTTINNDNEYDNGIPDNSKNDANNNITSGNNNEMSGLIIFTIIFTILVVLVGIGLCIYLYNT